MAVIKRMLGWKQAGRVIPRPLQVLAGMVPERDPDAYLERLRERKEAEEERKAIQAEGCKTRADAAAKTLPECARPVTIPSSDLEASAPELGAELPRRAADGWYRLGMTFYRIGQGPFRSWGDQPPAPASGQLVQGTLF